MNVLIIGNGVGHNIQYPPSQDDPLASEKQRFREFLQKMILVYKAEFIGEEALHGKETTAQCFGPAWANIDMPLATREELGIANEQRARARIPRYLGDAAKTALTEFGYQRELQGGWVEIEPLVPSDRIRERYMFECATQSAGEARNIILICGIIHAMQLRKMFKDKFEHDQIEVRLWESA
jgi:hypothetical protein